MSNFFKSRPTLPEFDYSQKQFCSTVIFSQTYYFNIFETLLYLKGHLPQNYEILFFTNTLNINQVIETFVTLYLSNPNRESREPIKNRGSPSTDISPHFLSLISKAPLCDLIHHFHEIAPENWIRTQQESMPIESEIVSLLEKLVVSQKASLNRKARHIRSSPSNPKKNTTTNHKEGLSRTSRESRFLPRDSTAP